MKVAIVIDSIMRAGAERQALYTARGLARRGCDVELVYYTRSSCDYDLGLAGDARATYLPKEGRPLRFFRRLRERLYYPPRQGAFEVREILRQQLYHLARVIEGQDPDYVPFVPA